MSFYAIQVMTGKEDAFIELFHKARPDATLHNIKKKIQSRRKGKPVSLSSTVFPGYLFLQCPESIDPDMIKELRRTKNFTRVLPSTDRISPLNERDTRIISQLLSFGKEIGPSLVVFDEQNRIKVIKGPLMGLEGQIVKVDKRKRRAKVRLDMNDSPILFDLAFEIIEHAEKAEA
ncbi:MAG TPA: antiterminator LoaP [Rectinemataceae bacterium]